MASNPAHPLWQLDAATALDQLRNGDVGSEEYAKSLFERIRKRDPDVKAWAYISPSKILQQAQRLDGMPKADKGVIHGLPVGVKDIILTKDLPTQYNSKIFESEEPIRMDAHCVVTLRAAGAVIFGKTTTTEFATSKACNWHQNLTTNPHDKTRSPGGSSSGSGAAVADYQVPIALGTQTGGSIIRPASFNGCYGFKPTWGTISKDGIASCAPTLDTLGFFSRTVNDIDIMMDVFHIHDDQAPSTTAFNLQNAKIGFYKSHYWPNAGPGTQKAMQKAQEILKKHGAKVEEVQLPEDFSHVLEWHTRIMRQEAGTSFLCHYLTDKSKLNADIVGMIENSTKISRKDQLEAYDGCARLRPLFDDIASRYDAIITPSVVDEAPQDISWSGDMNFCSTWTVMHVPALNLPGFAGENGMPVGLTAVAPRYRDRHLLHVARTLGPVFEAEGGFQRKDVDELSKQAASGFRSS